LTSIDGNEGSVGSGSGQLVADGRGTPDGGGGAAVVLSGLAGGGIEGLAVDLPVVFATAFTIVNAMNIAVTRAIIEPHWIWDISRSSGFNFHCRVIKAVPREKSKVANKPIMPSLSITAKLFAIH